MSDLKARVNSLSPNKQALLALRLDARQDAIPQTSGRAGKRLTAYVVPAEERQVTDRQLRDFLRARLPEYMLPAFFVQLGALPLSPNGKIDRGALKRPAAAGAPVPDHYVAPRTDLEEELAAIWKAVLRIERVGITDNFFELGGHSLLATQLISRVREAFFVELPLRSVFEVPTVAGLATAVVRAQLEEAGEAEAVEPPTEAEDKSEDDATPEAFGD